MEIDKEKEASFHKKRIAFLIINNEIMFLQDSTMSHYDWAKSIGQEDNFNSITRGYFIDNNIYFYYGNFDVNDNVVSDAKKYTPIICKKFNISNPNVYGGMIVGEVGTVWQPKIKII